MFGRRSNSENGNAHEDDDRLNTLLGQWKGVEPQAAFEAAVWRRIRLSAVTETRESPVLSRFREWLLPHPAWASALAAAAGIVVGIGLGFSGPGARAEHRADEPLLHPQTLTGTYLTLVTGETR